MGTMTAETEDPHKHFGAELWGLLLSIIFMDLPYFALRLYAIVAYEVLNYGILFFTCKNALMLVLLSYRLIIVVVKIKSERKDATEKQQNLDF